MGTRGDSSMALFDLDNLCEQRRRANRLYLEFLRVPALSAGVYELPAGGVDRQQPHKQDEVYYVVKGHARIQIGNEDHEVKSGRFIFVEAGVEHRFHSILEDLTLLVLFAPPES